MCAFGWKASQKCVGLTGREELKKRVRCMKRGRRSREGNRMTHRNNEETGLSGRDGACGDTVGNGRERRLEE